MKPHSPTVELLLAVEHSIENSLDNVFAHRKIGTTSVLDGKLMTTDLKMI
jgi:hypothetical protein